MTRPSRNWWIVPAIILGTAAWAALIWSVI